LPIVPRSTRLSRSADPPAVVTAIAIDPRGQFVAAAGDDFKIQILEISNLHPVATLAGHRDVIRSLAFDPAGNRLASAGNDGQLILWQRDQTFRIEQQMQGTPALACVRFSADGNEIAAVGFASEVFLIGRGKRETPQFRCGCRDLRAVAYRDDNRLLAAAGRSGDLHLFDPLGGQMIGDHPLHTDRIHGLVFHRQANTVVCAAEDGSVSVFDTQQQQLLHRIPVTTGRLFAIALLNSQLVAVAGSDNVIRVVNTDEGVVVRELAGHTGSVSALAAGGGVLFSGSYDATLRRWPVGDFEQSASRIAEGDPRLDR
jgi:WD40 repeat protein